MYCARSCGETEYGSRHGTGGSVSRRGSSPVALSDTRAPAAMTLVSASRDGRRPGRGRPRALWSENEFRIPERTHLWNVQSLELDLRGDPVTPNRLDDQVQREAEREHEANQRRHSYQLRDQLSRISVEETGDRAGHAVPCPGIVAPAVGKQPDRDNTPETVGAVHGNRAHD